MPVPAVPPVVEHLGNGVTTVFPYGYKILANADMTVWLDDVLQTGGYTVSGAGVDAGGNVTFSVAPAASVVVRLQRFVSLARTTDYQEGGAFRADQVDSDQDKQTMQIQQVNEEVSRALKFPPGSPPAAVYLPTPEPLKFLGWDQDAGAVVNYDPADFATLAATSNWKYKLVAGDGTAMLITLDDNPGVIANLDISVGGVTQTPVTDYTISGKDVQFVGIVPLGEPVLIRYGTALPQGYIDQAAVNGSADVVRDYAAAAAYSGDKDLLYVLCRSTIGDGGHGYFDHIKTTAGRPAANDGTIIHTAGGWLARKFAGPLKVKWFGVIGDGSDETAKLSNVFSAMPTNNATVDFCGLDIHVGTYTAKQVDKFVFTNRRGITFANIGKITAINNINTAGYPDWSSVFKFVNCSDLDLDVNTEFSPLVAQTGMICPIEIQTTTAATGDQTGYKIRSRTKYGHAPLLINRPQSEINATVMSRPMASDFVVDLYADYGNYGLNCVYNGTGITGSIRTKNVARSYFPVDTSGHNLKIVSESHRILTDVLIKSYFRDVSGIVVDYSGIGDVSTTGSIFTLEFENNAQNTSITDISARISSDKDAPAVHPQIVLNRQFNTSGVVQATTNSRIDNIKLDLLLSGTQRFDVDTVYVESKQSTRGSVILSGKKFNCKSTNGLTFVRGNTLISAASGQFVAGAGGSLYFDLEGLYGDWTGHAILEIVADADFTTTIYEAYQKWAFRVVFPTDGSTLTVLNLTKLEERLYDETNSPVVTIAALTSPFLLQVNVATARATDSLSRLHGRLTIFADVV